MSAPSPSSPAWQALEEKASFPWKLVFAGAGVVGVLAMIGIAGGEHGAGAIGSSALVSGSAGNTAERSRDSAQAAEIRARLAAASRADLATLDYIDHRWGLPHDSATHARAQTAMLDSARALLDGKAVNDGGRSGAVLAALRDPLTPRQTELRAQLLKRSQARTEETARAQAEAASRATDAAKWSYSAYTDEMSGRTARTAVITSENTVEFDFPYQGSQNARLTIRNHPQYGRDVIVQIERGQILCPSYDDCTVRVRFDDGSPERFAAAGAADHSSTSVFIRANGRFLERMRRAKVVRIQIPVYQEGNPAFEFRVAGYDHGRFTRGD